MIDCPLGQKLYDQLTAGPIEFLLCRENLQLGMGNQGMYFIIFLSLPLRKKTIVKYLCFYKYRNIRINCIYFQITDIRVYVFLKQLKVEQSTRARQAAMPQRRTKIFLSKSSPLRIEKSLDNPIYLSRFIFVCSIKYC